MVGRYLPKPVKSSKCTLPVSSLRSSREHSCTGILYCSRVRRELLHPTACCPYLCGPSPLNRSCSPLACRLPTRHCSQLPQLFQAVQKQQKGNWLFSYSFTPHSKQGGPAVPQFLTSCSSDSATESPCLALTPYSAPSSCTCQDMLFLISEMSELLSFL